MLKRLVTFSQGYLQLRITGSDIEKLLNRLMHQDFKLWNIIRIEDSIYVNIKLRDFKRIKKHIKNLDCKVKINQKKGVPFWLKKILNRKFLMMGLVVFIAIIYISSSFLLFIEVQGNEEVKRSEIINFLEVAKIKPGVLKSSIPVEKLEKLLIEKNPKVSWVHIYFEGTKLIVELVEKDTVNTEINPSDIIAQKSGIITELIILRGTPMVKEGMTVQKGDLLISKELKIKKEDEDLSSEDKDEESFNFEIKELKAEGIIKAKVWYEGYGEAKSVKRHKQPTSNETESLVIKFKEKEFRVKGPKVPPYTQFEVKEEVKSFSKWRNIDLPIELIRRRYIQIKEFKEKRDLKIVKRLAKEDAVKSILQGISKEAIILNSKLWLIDSEDNLIRVKALLEVEEDIGVRREAP